MLYAIITPTSNYIHFYFYFYYYYYFYRVYHKAQNNRTINAISPAFRLDKDEITINITTMRYVQPFIRYSYCISIVD